MAIPGMEGGCYAATGLEHTERGAPNFTPKMHTLMSIKRAKKIEEASKEKGFTARFGPKKAKIGNDRLGIHAGRDSAKALEMATQQGYSVAHLQLKMVYPLPEADIREFLSSVEEVIVAELNFGGQFNQILRSKFLIPTHSLTKCEGLAFFTRKKLPPRSKAVSTGEKRRPRRRGSWPFDLTR